jgi:hypothetical protein
MRRALLGIVTVLVAACVRPATQFDRYMAAGQWVDAAREFSNDSLLQNDEEAIYQAAVLHGTPDRPTYDPTRARGLFQGLLTKFPGTKHRDDAAARMMLLDDVLRTRRVAAARERELEDRIAALMRDAQTLRVRIDSSAAHSDSLRGAIARLETVRKDRETELAALRLELQKLKEIDLKPRPTRPPSREPSKG